MAGDDSRRPPRRTTGRPSGKSAPSRSPRTGQKAAGPRRSSRGGRPERSTGPAPRTAEQQRYDGPDLPDDVSSSELDRAVLRQLSSLPERLADRVGRHLAMAARALYEDPELAFQHALAARSRAARVGVVREACGETAYAAGHFAEALAEFRAARRMTGSPAYLPMMADCERALKRPTRALALAADAGVGQLDRAGQVEMAIVAAGARRDMGQLESAIQLLEAEDLRSRSHADWVARLRYAYADTLLAAGRREDAVEWFHRTVAVDSERVTDADERLSEVGETGR